MIGYIQSSCKLPSVTIIATVIHEDNSACISHMQGGYIKGDRMMHISPKRFTHMISRKEGAIEV